jgi:3,4-dihydroxy-2-butanone 4-phosphate synthase
MAEYSNGRIEITTVGERIYRLKPVEGIEMNVDDVRQAREIYLKLSAGQFFSVLLDATGSFTISDEARALIASKEYSVQRKAAALVTPGLVNRLVGNFFIQFNKPGSPTKLFNDEASALAWLEEQMNKHK